MIYLQKFCEWIKEHKRRKNEKSWSKRRQNGRNLKRIWAPRGIHISKTPARERISSKLRANAFINNRRGQTQTETACSGRWIRDTSRHYNRQRPFLHLPSNTLLKQSLTIYQISLQFASVFETQTIATQFQVYDPFPKFDDIQTLQLHNHAKLVTIYFYFIIIGFIICSHNWFPRKRIPWYARKNHVPVLLIRKSLMRNYALINGPLLYSPQNSNLLIGLNILS